jgi:hypothetical protein
MSKAFQILRFIFVLGLLWALVWGTVGTIVGTIIWAFDSESIDPGEEFLPLVVALVGFIVGVCFGGLLSVAERGKPLFQVSLFKAAMWGALINAGATLWETHFPAPFKNSYAQAVGPGLYAMPQVVGQRIVMASGNGHQG